MQSEYMKVTGSIQVHTEAFTTSNRQNAVIHRHVIVEADSSLLKISDDISTSDKLLVWALGKPRRTENLNNMCDNLVLLLLLYFW